MLFVRYKFWHIEHNNTTLCTHFSKLSLVSVWHLMKQQKGALSNLYSTNCSDAPSVVWNPHFVLVLLVIPIFISISQKAAEIINAWFDIWNKYLYYYFVSFCEDDIWQKISLITILIEEKKTGNITDKNDAQAETKQTPGYHYQSLTWSLFK